MTIRTRTLNSEEARAHFKIDPAIGTSTEETLRVNALTFLNEMVKPVRNPRDDVVRFRPVPHEPALRDRLLWQEIRAWQILVMPTDHPGQFLALELQGDIVIGSNAAADTDLDVNLAYLDGYERGVSRRHILLRPSRERLYVIDLNSTNGTSVNGMPSPVGEAHALRDSDLLTLGRMHLQIKIARRPEPVQR
jgi:hypothetical protein